MRTRALGWLLVAGLLPFVSVGQLASGNLLKNGRFEHPEGALHGWMTDYAWTENRNYVDNAARISVVPQESGRRNVVRLRPPLDIGAKMETILIPFELGQQYRASLMVKGGPYRIYFSGYQWRPGIRPHSNPTHAEMRPAYRSKAEVGQSANWERVTLEIPGVDASALSLQHLRRVRFITLYIFFLEDGFIDDVVINRLQ